MDKLIKFDDFKIYESKKTNLIFNENSKLFVIVSQFDKLSLDTLGFVSTNIFNLS